MKILSLSFILFFSVFTFVQAQSLQEEKADEYVNRYLELKRFNGAVLVAKKQEILFNKGYGLADYAHGIPIDRKTTFCITGLTEQITAYIALKVMEEQGLSLHTPVKDFLGDSKFTHTGAITLHHLLSHTSGLPDFPLMHELPEKQAFSKEGLISHIANIPLEGKAGAAFRHSKLNYNLVGLILEELTAKPFEALLKELVTGPIGMKNTDLDDFSSIKKNRAQGYYRRNLEEGWENAPYLDPSNTFASQGILSTTEDLLLWNDFIRHHYLQNALLQEMLTPTEGGFGYGLQVKKSEANEIEEVRSTGGYGSGYNSFSILNRESGITVIVLGNNRNPSSEEIAEGLHAIFTKQDYVLPLPRKVVKLDPALLQKLAGDYKINEQLTLKVFVEGNRLFVNDGMRPPFEIFPQSENQFFVEGTDAEIVFIKNEEGVVSRIGLRNDGFTNAFAEKVRK